MVSQFTVRHRVLLVFDCVEIIDRLIEISKCLPSAPRFLALSRHNMDLREIARRARVSTATASRAINRVPTVDPQLSRRVWKVVDELGILPQYPEPGRWSPDEAESSV